MHLWRAQGHFSHNKALSAGFAQHDKIFIALGVIVFFTAVAGLWALRDTVAGLGSDSYHHTLITQMIINQGGLPDDYRPLAPIATFTYHFGFHGVVASIGWTTGLGSVPLVPIVGQVLNAAASLSVGTFTLTVTRHRLAAVISAALTGLVTVFPAFFVNWGRYPQLIGLVMLPTFLGVVWRWAQAGAPGSWVPFIGGLAAGIALAHYRIALMAASGVLVLIGLDGLLSRSGRATWRRITQRLALAAAVATTLIGPWVWHVLTARQHGYPAAVGVAAPTFFKLERLGIRVLHYPTNPVVIGLAAAAVIWGWWRQERIVILLSAWVIAMWIVSTPGLAGIFLDRISVIVSFYFPVSVIAGVGVAAAIDRLTARWRSARYAVGIGLLGLMVWGGVTIGSITRPSLAYVTADDLTAAAWIREHTPPGAYFMVNTYHWDFLPHFVVGSDAGYWLPLLAGRRTVTAPMTYVFERLSEPDFVPRLVALDRLQGRLASPEALALLRREGITHVYVGGRGGHIALDELLNAPAFDLAYQYGDAYVFRLR